MAALMPRPAVFSAFWAELDWWRWWPGVGRARPGRRSGVLVRGRKANSLSPVALTPAGQFAMSAVGPAGPGPAGGPRGQPAARRWQGRGGRAGGLRAYPLPARSRACGSRHIGYMRAEPANVIGLLPWSA